MKKVNLAIGFLCAPIFAMSGTFVLAEEEQIFGMAPNVALSSLDVTPLGNLYEITSSEEFLGADGGFLDIFTPHVLSSNGGDVMYYRLNSVPNPDNRVNEYLVWSVNGQDICGVLASGLGTTFSNFGGRIPELLEEKYGAAGSSSNDMDSRGSWFKVWGNPSDGEPVSDEIAMISFSYNWHGKEDTIGLVTYNVAYRFVSEECGIIVDSNNF